MVYDALDWFYVEHHKQPVSDRFIQLNLHRDAKVYLIVSVQYNNDFPPARLPGWNSEGWAIRVDRLDREFVFGVHQTQSRYLPTRVYIFSRGARGTAILPSNDWVTRSVSGVNVIGGWYAMVAEHDGKPSEKPAQPNGVSETILPNRRCPDALHGLWVTPETDASDADVRGRMWPTWHPQWDPCYWCLVLTNNFFCFGLRFVSCSAYDHEHGSSALAAMNYAPKFGYTPWKNNREEESHEGFKCAVLRARSYYVCFCIHMQASKLRRVSVRNHTIIFAVSEARTKELLAEVTHKGFFGFTGVRAREGGFVGLTNEEEELQIELYENERITNKRSVNVINIHSLNPAYEYNRVELVRGTYEEWATNPICSGSGRSGMLTMDITNPITGIVSSTKADESVSLGRENDGTFKRNDGSTRLLLIGNFIFSDDLCSFENEDGRAADGTFYTDVSGRKLMSGPSRNSVRQFVKRGFKMEMSGKYTVVDPWGGEFMLDKGIGRSSNGFGLDPDVN
ncbi:hypothetical protein FGB62_10g212 [Gracilaria domingensis]|nr:hypothetical protein FGB62_10g212 [Gracilaria domingensis]